MDDTIKHRIREIINIFETDTLTTDYSTLYRYHDGPNQRVQLTIGWGLTESGNLKFLIQEYIKRNGKYSDQFKNYVDRIGTFKPDSLANDADFKKLIVAAAKEDQIMRDCSDLMYDLAYWNKAVAWFESNGFTKNLSLCVIQDSMIHSGSILPFLRNKFDEPTPAHGGRESVWVESYVRARENWLANASNQILHSTVYRPQFFLRQIQANNWDLNLPLLNIHGRNIIS